MVLSTLVVSSLFMKSQCKDGTEPRVVTHVTQKENMLSKWGQTGSIFRLNNAQMYLPSATSSSIAPLT